MMGNRYKPYLFFSSFFSSSSSRHLRSGGVDRKDVTTRDGELCNFPKGLKKRFVVPLQKVLGVAQLIFERFTRQS